MKLNKGVPIRAITRSMAALQAINRHGSLSLTQISRAIKVPFPTTCRIVQTLLYEGFVEQVPSRKRYRPTLMVETLACGFQGNDELIRIARPHIVKLARRLGWPITISIRVGRNMIIRDVAGAYTPITFDDYYASFALPALDSACGKLSMAFARHEDRKSILNWMRSSPDTDKKHLETAERNLGTERILEQGFAIQESNDCKFEPTETGSIAVPIFKDGQFEAAMALTFRTSAMRGDEALRKYLDDLAETGKLISASLSGSNNLV